MTVFIDDLPMRTVGAGDLAAAFIKQERLRPLRALVDGKNVFHCSASFAFAAMPSAVSP